jgi:T-complex protein 1 subunit theta
LARDPRLLAGAGAIEIELYREVTKLAEETDGLDQYAIRKFAEAFLVIPRTLAESSGLSSSTVLTNLNSNHEKGEKNFGVDIESEEGLDSVKTDLFDCYLTKFWAIKLAVQSTINILSIDQIIMSRPSGGPKVPSQNPNGVEDE